MSTSCESRIFKGRSGICRGRLLGVGSKSHARQRHNNKDGLNFHLVGDFMRGMFLARLLSRLSGVFSSLRESNKNM